MYQGLPMLARTGLRKTWRLTGENEVHHPAHQTGDGNNHPGKKRLQHDSHHQVTMLQHHEGDSVNAVEDRDTTGHGNSTPLELPNTERRGKRLS
mmetsp:Transcript_15905/g.43368  ORF Transcript_15905/g.43368 Transcript_15905/m.43368 type:complete len:94 (-) Transcript_15905:1126-1407(-)